VAFFGTIGLLALYILAYGPVVWLLWHVELPKAVGNALAILFSPVSWTDSAVKGVSALEEYVELWLSFSEERDEPATAFVSINRPPYVLEFLGCVLAAWLTWNLVRWVNQRGLAHSRAPGRP
jgi:hypothetical protein